MLEGFSKDHLVWLEYGLQSIHPRTLKLINRGHGPEAFFDAVERTRQRKIAVVAHLILGLPGESVADMIETVRSVAEAGVEGVKLHPLYVVRGTALEQMCREGSYQPLTEADALQATLAVLGALPPEMVIHRLTSDPHAEELVAPLWMLDRHGVRNRLIKEMELRDFRQGSPQSAPFGQKPPLDVGRSA
jgi:radical SAM protein (TIGR01212 family)